MKLRCLDQPQQFVAKPRQNALDEIELLQYAHIMVGGLVIEPDTAANFGKVR